MTHVREGCICKATPLPQGAVPSAPQFWGFLLFMHTPFDAELANLTW